MRTQKSIIGPVWRQPAIWKSLIRLAGVAMLVVIEPVCFQAWASDTIYRDARRPSFSLLVPDGWTAAYVTLLVQLGAFSPGTMLVQLRPQFESQFKNFQELDSGQSMLAQHRAGYAVYEGVPPSGVKSTLRIITTTNGKLTYTLFVEAHTDEMPRYERDLNRIPASFAVEESR